MRRADKQENPICLPPRRPKTPHKTPATPRQRKMILTNCAACAAPLAHNAPRCVRCWTRYGSDSEAECEWRKGVVIKHHWRDGDIAIGLFAPYQVQLDDGTKIYARWDTEHTIRAAGSH